jgi:hypothetical protein
MKSLPLWAHSLLRFFVPAPCGVLATIGFVYLHLSFVPKPDVPAQHAWHPISLLLLLPVGFCAGFFAARWLIALIPSRCLRCGGQCHPARGGSSRLYDCTGCSQPVGSPIDPSTIFVGLAFTAAGLLVMFIPLLLPHATPNGPRWVVIPFGLVFVVVGLLALGIWRPIEAWLNRRFPATARVDWHNWLGVVIACGAGMALMSVGFFSTQAASAFPSGRAPVVVSGLVFFLAGVAIALPMFNKGRTDTIAQTVVGALLLSVFAGVPLLIAIGSGYAKLGLEGSAAITASFATTFALAGLGWWGVARAIRKRRANAPPNA